MSGIVYFDIARRELSRFRLVGASLSTSSVEETRRTTAERDRVEVVATFPGSNFIRWTGFFARAANVEMAASIFSPPVVELSRFRVFIELERLRFHD